MPIPHVAGHDATIPEDQIGPATLPLFCLAPHGVFRASRIASRAVSSYLAFSPLPALKKEQLFFQRTGGLFSVTLSVNPDLGRGRPRIVRGMLPYGVRTFLQQTPKSFGAHQRSSAIKRTLAHPAQKETELSRLTILTFSCSRQRLRIRHRRRRRRLLR